MSHSKKNAWLV